MLCLPCGSLQVWIAGARLELWAQNAHACSALLENALRCSPPKSLTVVLLDCARIEEFRGDLASARALLDYAREMPWGKKEWKVWLESILFERRAGQIQTAVALSEAALELHSGTGRLWAVLIQLKAHESPEDQLRVLYNALRLVPKSGEVWCEAARLFTNPKTMYFDLNRARKCLSFALQFTPQYGDSFIEWLRLWLLDAAGFHQANATVRTSPGTAASGTVAPLSRCPSRGIGQIETQISLPRSSNDAFSTPGPARRGGSVVSVPLQAGDTDDLGTEARWMGSPDVPTCSQQRRQSRYAALSPQSHSQGIRGLTGFASREDGDEERSPRYENRGIVRSRAASQPQLSSMVPPEPAAQNGADTVAAARSNARERPSSAQNRKSGPHKTQLGMLVSGADGSGSGSDGPSQPQEVIGGTITPASSLSLSPEMTRAPSTGPAPFYAHQPDLERLLLREDATEVERACANADPNYGTMWFFCKHAPYDSAKEILANAKRLLARDIAATQVMYAAALGMRTHLTEQAAADPLHAGHPSSHSPIPNFEGSLEEVNMQAALRDLKSLCSSDTSQPRDRSGTGGSLGVDSLPGDAVNGAASGTPPAIPIASPIPRADIVPPSPDTPSAAPGVDCSVGARHFFRSPADAKTGENTRPGKHGYVQLGELGRHHFSSGFLSLGCHDMPCNPRVASEDEVDYSVKGLPAFDELDDDGKLKVLFSADQLVA